MCSQHQTLLRMMTGCSQPQNPGSRGVCCFVKCLNSSRCFLLLHYKLILHRFVTCRNFTLNLMGKKDPAQMTNACTSNPSNCENLPAKEPGPRARFISPEKTHAPPKRNFTAGPNEFDKQVDVSACRLKESVTCLFCCMRLQKGFNVWKITPPCSGCHGC